MHLRKLGISLIMVLMALSIRAPAISAEEETKQVEAVSGSAIQVEEVMEGVLQEVNEVEQVQEKEEVVQEGVLKAKGEGMGEPTIFSEQIVENKETLVSRETVIANLEILGFQQELDGSLTATVKISNPADYEVFIDTVNLTMQNNWVLTDYNDDFATKKVSLKEVGIAINGVICGLVTKVTESLQQTIGAGQSIIISMSMKIPAQDKSIKENFCTIQILLAPCEVLVLEEEQALNVVEVATGAAITTEEPVVEEIEVINNRVVEEVESVTGSAIVVEGDTTIAEEEKLNEEKQPEEAGIKTESEDVVDTVNEEESEDSLIEYQINEESEVGIETIYDTELQVIEESEVNIEESEISIEESEVNIEELSLTELQDTMESEVVIEEDNLTLNENVITEEEVVAIY